MSEEKRYFEVMMMSGKKIRGARKKAGLTQLELAAIINVADSTISHYENERRYPHPDIRKKLAIALDVPLDALYELRDVEYG